MIKRFNYTPILGWSVSRYDKFKLCRRQYYYEYYAKYDKAYAKIKELKKLTSNPLAIGIVVHDIISVLLDRLLKSEEAIDVNRFLDFAERSTERYCQENIFAEVYYNEISSVEQEILFDVIKNICLPDKIIKLSYGYIISHKKKLSIPWIDKLQFF